MRDGCARWVGAYNLARGVALLIAALSLAACVSRPEGIYPVKDFEVERYLGKWYEIARLDHSFERGLSRVTAEYSRREDGGVKVVNRGYSEQDGEWDVAEGRAYFVEEPDTGYLKVSFFGPFYGAYVIFELDHEGYQYSLVSGPDRSYLWILARTAHIGPQRLQRLVDEAKRRGFPTDELIFVEQGPVPE